MKRSCNGCKARDIVDGKFSCDLGYKVQHLQELYVEKLFVVSSKPLEECPKPRTYKKYRELHNIKIEKVGY